MAEFGVEITYSAFENEELKNVIYSPGKYPEKVKQIGKAFGRRWSAVRDLSDFDCVYVFREAAIMGPPLFEWLIARSKKPMIFDFDDAIYLRSEGSENGYLNLLKFAGKTRSICRMSTHVMAGNQHLASFAKAVNDNVTIIPTTIDTNKYRIENGEKHDELTIGWSGSFSTVIHLNTLRTALQRLAKERKFKLRVIGTPTYELDGVDVEAMDWRAATELEDLGRIDIGVMPLPDDEWSKGKCGLKALQYMALGIPTICSPVGVNSDIIQDGHNGFLASSDDEWIEKLKLLLDSEDRRREIGALGMQTVIEEYSAHSQAPRVFELFERTINSKN